MTMPDATEQVREAVAKAGGMRALARKWGFSATLVWKAYHGQVAPCISRKLGIGEPPRKPNAPRRVQIGPRCIERVYEAFQACHAMDGTSNVTRISRIAKLSYDATRTALEELERQGRVKMTRPTGKNRKFLPVE